MIRYLEPVYDGANSFYKKATVEFQGDNAILYSYGTKVCVIDKTKKEAEILGFYSQTTTRHIKDFLYQNSFEIGGKQFLYENYTPEGKQEVLEKEQKKIQKEKERIERAIIRKEEQRLLREAKKLERIRLKEDLTKELGDVCSKREINRLVTIEINS